MFDLGPCPVIDASTTSRLSSKLSPLLSAGLAAVLLVILGTATTSYWNARALFDESQWVAHSHEVRETLSDLLSAVQEAETNERGFIITGEETYIALYDAARRDVPDLLRHLRDLIADNAEQQQRLGNLQPHVETLLTWLHDTD